jgi:hypothetical protein
MFVFVFVLFCFFCFVSLVCFVLFCLLFVSVCFGLFVDVCFGQLPEPEVVTLGCKCVWGKCGLSFPEGSGEELKKHIKEHLEVCFPNMNYFF